jgi:predicted DNA-binding transcriptional regulator YafY
VRASRLVTILLLLQSRGQMTAPELAEQLEVSVRTIYRDLEALSEAGVPVYGETGPSGGYRLVEGYQTRLTGLNPAEAEALILAGVPGPLGALGLGGALVGGQRKLEAALPDELRARATKARQRFHVDLAGWFQPQVVPPLLGPVAAAVWEERRLRIDYRPRDGQPGEREVDPLGLVIKAATWYLVAAAPTGLRTYRVSRIVAVEVLDERCRRPKGFDLEKFWAAELSEYEASLPSVTVEMRAAPETISTLRGLVDHRSLPSTDWEGQPDQGGWRRLSVTFERLDDVTAAALTLGDQAEILGPANLRSSVAEKVTGLARLYASAAPGAPGP